MDTQGLLTKEEFAQGLRESGLDVSGERAGALMEKFDVSGNAKLACWEFIRMVTAGGGETKADLPKEVLAPTASNLLVKGDEGEIVQAEIIKNLQIDESELLTDFKRQVEEENLKIHKVFSRIVDGGKTVTADQFLTGLKELGCATISKDTAERIVDRYDIDGTGKLKYYEFLRMMNDVC
ncbi:hypothetical protein TrCOL_g9479 [Triparma columacea]|uniref:EF-hand domain-containing protein n=1 Tax=Triparma columacea TaxID=722753 RepID=A0A9W7LE92_9STRA|nr:hypothetical protein TrCOL_g9479 [Triparma columacea]